MENTQERIRAVWPDWRIESKLGKGSFGTVYKAVREEDDLRAEAAVKVIEIPSDPAQIDALRAEGMDEVSTRSYLESLVKDFGREIKVMVDLKGAPNIVAIDDFKVLEKKDSIGWTVLIRMELLTPLNTYMSARRMDEDELIHLGMDMCEALRICSSRDIIHRDIKPQNVFKDRFGGFKLGDFGIARKIEHTTHGMSHKGTFNYMAPEIYNGKPYDGRADICSLGVMLYQLANEQRLPFIAQTDKIYDYNERMNALSRRMNGDRLPPPSGVSAAFARIILKACAYLPEDRYPDAVSMKADLERLLKRDDLTETVVMEEDRTEALPVNSQEDPDGEATELLVAGEIQDETETVTVEEPGGRPVPGHKRGFTVLKAAAVAGILLAAAVFVVMAVRRGSRSPQTVLADDSLYVPEAVAAYGGAEADAEETDQTVSVGLLAGADDVPEHEAFLLDDPVPQEEVPTVQSNAPVTEEAAEEPAREPEEARLCGISIKKEPDAAPHFAGERVSTEGMVLALEYSDQSEKTVTEGFSVTPEFYAAGSQEITVRYEGFTAGYRVSAEEIAVQSVTVSSPPAKASYIIGESFQPDGLKLKVVYNNGDVKIVSEGFRCEPERLKAAGEQQITVSFEKAQTVCRVSVLGAGDILKQNDLTGMPENDAMKALGQYGLIVSVEREAADGAHTGKVLSAAATSDQSVTLVIGKLTEFTFKEKNGSIIVTGVSRITDLLDIPERINGLPVTEIGDAAFNEWDSDGNTGIDSVRFPSGLVRIGEGAFYGCRYLSRVTFPEKLTEIADHAFSYCTALMEADFGNVETIGDYAFQYCRLQSIEIPKTCRKIGEEAFISITAAVRIVLPSSLTEIGPGAFTGCSRAEFAAEPGSYAAEYLAESGIGES